MKTVSSPRILKYFFLASQQQLNQPNDLTIFSGQKKYCKKCLEGPSAQCSLITFIWIDAKNFLRDKEERALPESLTSVCFIRFKFRIKPSSDSQQHLHRAFLGLHKGICLFLIELLCFTDIAQDCKLLL